MKNHKKIIFYSLFIFSTQVCHYNSVMAIAEKFGYETLKAAEPLIKVGLTQLDKTGGTLAEGVKELVAALPNAGADFGTNFGVGLADKIGMAVSTTCTAAKSTYVAVAASPITPVITTVVVGGVIVVIIAYGSYKIYRYYRPTTAQQAAEIKMKLNIAQSQSAIIALNATQEKAQKEAEFKKALLQHASSAEKTTSGIPIACQKQAQELAIVAGHKKVDKIVAAFVKYKPQPQCAMVARA